MINKVLESHPSRRLTKPEDVAKVVALIGLNKETWMTGNVIRVDGGEDITG